MKIKLGIWVLFLCAGSVFAGFIGFDDFADASKNSAKWGTDINSYDEFSQSGDGVLRLSFAGTTPRTNDFIEWPWILGNGPFLTNWSVQMDVHLSTIGFSGAGFSSVGLGIGVRNSSDTNDSFAVYMENRHNTPQEQYNFVNPIRINGALGPTSSVVPSASTNATVRISWDATSHMLSADYATNGTTTTAYQWTRIATFDPLPGSNWNMSAAQSFTIFVRGYSSLVYLSTNQNVYCDNFYAVDDGTPTLSFHRNGGQTSMVWPRIAVGFELQTSPFLGGPWTAATNAVISSATENSMVIQASDPITFFRLRK